MSANQGRKLNTYQEVTTLETGSNFIINQLVGGVLKVKQLTKAGFLAIINALIVSSRVESITYANLLIKVNAGLAEVGKKYLITNATAAQFNLEVEAIAVNQIGCDAKDPLYPNDKVVYNFATNTITWRWDTIADISAGEDWRNSSDLQIGDNCTHIEIGANCIIAIGDNCSNIKIGNGSGAVGSAIGDGCENIEIGNDCTSIKIFAGSTFIKAGNNCSIELLAICVNIKMTDNCSLSTIANKTLGSIKLFDSAGLSATDSIVDLSAYAGADISASTFIYSVTQTKTLQLGASGLPRLIYLNGSNVLVNVDAEA